MNSDLFFLFNFGIPIGMSGQFRLMTTDGEIADGLGFYDSFPGDVLEFGYASIGDEEEEEFLIGSSSETVFADMADAVEADGGAVEADGGAVLTAFGEAAIGSDGGDLLMGDGGIDAGLMAELLAGIGEVAA